MNQRHLSHYFKWIVMSAWVGTLAGAGSAVFLLALDWATTTRLAHPVLIFGLPLAGLLTGLLYKKFGQGAERGHHLIVEEIHEPKSIVPKSMTPLVFIGSVLSHLSGASVGREGAAVQIGASLADQWSRVFKFNAAERRLLLSAGMGAGFGAAIGAPWAGVIFGMEVTHVRGLKFFAWAECLVASLVGYQVSRLLHAPHTVYPQVTVPGMSAQTVLAVIAAGAVFGGVARVFVLLTHAFEQTYERLQVKDWLRPVLGGVFLVIAYQVLRADLYSGLGIHVIQDSLMRASTWNLPVVKSLLTALSVASGFRGGEFVPLVYIGTTLGSAMSVLVPSSGSLLAVVGFASVFAGAANTPLACSVMAVELFGWAVAPYALLACLMSYLCSGRRGIYRSQR